MTAYPKFIQLLNNYLYEQDRSASWLANRLRVRPSTVSRWQSGDRRPGKPETIVRIADILGIHDEEKRQELLIAAGYGYQAPTKTEEAPKEDAPVDCKEADFETPPAPPTEALSGGTDKVLLRPKSRSIPSESLRWRRKRPSKQLIGVSEHLKQLEEVLLSGEPPWVVSISGIGGIGKTSLAEALVRRLMAQDAARRAFEGACWLSAQQEMFNLRGNIKPLESPTLTVKALLEALVMQLLGIKEARPCEEALASDEALALLQNHLQQYPHLIVLDNLETLTDLESLLPTLHDLAAPTKFLLTSRESLFGEADVYHFSLPELSQADALALVKQEAKLRNLPHLYESDLDVLKQIYDTVGGNPLALRLVVGQTHIHQLSVVLDDLAGACGEEAENLYGYIYQFAWNNLENETRQLFAGMLLVSEAGGSRDYIEHVSQLARKELHKSLRLLVSLNLLDVDQDLSAWRYTIHRLTRTFLQKQLAEAESDTELAVLFGTYLRRSAQYIYRLIEQTTSSLSASEQELALHILNHALEVTEIWPEVRDLCLLLAPKMEQAGARSGWMAYLARAISQSLSQGDVSTYAEFLFQLGVLYHHQAEFNKARHRFSESATHFEQLGNSHHQARALNRLANVARRQHRFEDATELAETALRLLGEAQEEQAYSYSVLGNIAFNKREWQKANDFYVNSLALWEETNNPRLIAGGLNNLGMAKRVLKRYDEAKAVYKRAINLFEAIQDPVSLAVARMNLGNVYLQINDPRQALKLYLQAEPEFYKTEARLRLARAYLNKAIAYEKLEQWAKAKQAYLASIEQWEEIGSINSLVNAMDGLGGVYLALQLCDEAITTYQNGLELLTQSQGDPNYEHLLSRITQNLESAIEQCQESAELEK